MSEDKKSGSSKDQPKNNMTLYIAIGAGVLVLSCCCFTSAGGGLWWFLSRGPSGGGGSLETKIIGKWVPDNPPGVFGIEFKADKSVIDASPLTPIILGKWKTISTKDDTITVELSDAANKTNLEIKVVDNDHLKIPHPVTKKEFAFKRGK